MVDEILVLIRLRLSKAERLDQRLLLCDLLILRLDLRSDQFVMDGAIVRVLVVDDVAGRVLDRIVDRTGVRRHIIAHLSNRLTVLTATILQLRLKCVGILHIGDIHIVDRLLKTKVTLLEGVAKAIEALKQRGIHAIKAVAEPLFEAVELIHDRLIVKTTLDRGVRCGRIRHYHPNRRGRTG